MNRERFRAAGIIVLAGSIPAALPAQAGGASWVEGGGFYHHVSNDFGSWKGGYLRAVVAGSRDVWYGDLRVQEAFRDRGVYGAVANVHTFSDRFYTQIGVGGGTGEYVLPDLRADASLNLKLGRARSLIATAGGTYVKSKDVFRDQALFGSLTWYARPTVLVELGGRINWTEPNPVRSARTQLALALGRAGTTLVTLRGSAGTEGYQLTGAPETRQKFASQEVSLSWRQWILPRLGTVLGGEWYHNPAYTRTGLTAGLFHAW